MTPRVHEALSADACRDLQGQLAERLVALRGQFQEAAASYSVHVQGMLADVGDTLAADDPSRLGSAELSTRAEALRRVLREVEQLSLKPSKGRRRDLKAIQRIAEHVSEVVAEW
ncbi:MAG TPA: hypothetical protein VG370_19835 [Chloroflexota bacterium]|nr:hypothetical protein [Chloroflexota bacterium]